MPRTPADENIKTIKDFAKMHVKATIKLVAGRGKGTRLKSGRKYNFVPWTGVIRKALV